MEMHQLEYVLAVAKYRNFTRAAEHVNTSQSTLSQQISKLENELGVSLFVRTTRSVELSPAGVDFISHAERIMSEVTDAQRCVNEYVSVEKGDLKLGIIPVVGHYRIPNLISSFKNSFPRVQLSLWEKQCCELLGMLQNYEIDAAFVHQLCDDTNIHFIPVVTDYMVILTNNSHPLANNKSVSLDELRDEDFIIPPPTSGYNHDFQEACHKASFKPKIILTCSSVKTILGLVREGVGIAALPSGVSYMDWGFGTKNLILTPKINSIIYLATKSKNLFPTLKEFIRFTARWSKNQSPANYFKFIPIKLTTAGRKL
ncbi:MAG: LysR family transcriptional regulator [Desulfotomaculaceae bacterium]|nr:LysR family transcriptional regulator [Desulfotomaculaceae bacterium]MDD4766123.1 LysR family transcriptional regulator [Desulfotomaculaceae bacterium]